MSTFGFGEITERRGRGLGATDRRQAVVHPRGFPLVIEHLANLPVAVVING
jgi:hypothetical protein